MARGAAGLTASVPRREDLPARVSIREVGPRDGLQSEAPLPVEVRAELLSMLSRTGLPKIEAVSFVSPKAVPAMAGAAEVWRRAERRPGVTYSALVPNRRGAEAAAEAGGFGALQGFLSATESYNRHNVGKPVQDSIADVAEVAAVGAGAGIPVECSVSCAFGDPEEGDVDPGRVLEVAGRLVDHGVSGISLADTTGMGTPTRVWDLVGRFRERFPGVRLNLHLHDTRGTALANVLAALLAGCDELDASLGGIGGSPFAPGAGGNVATEDLLHLLLDMGVETGLDEGGLEGLREIGHWLEGVLGHKLRSHVGRAGPRWTVSTPYRRMG